MSHSVKTNMNKKIPSTWAILVKLQFHVTLLKSRLGWQKHLSRTH